MNREIKFTAKCIETWKEYEIKTIDKPRDWRWAHNFKWRQNNGWYWIRLVEWHPNADSRWYVREHRLIMEEKLWRLLLKAEIVHHKDEDKMNNDIDNLEIYTNQKEHAKLHAENIERQDSKWYIKWDVKLEEEKYRLYNKRLWTTEIYTLSRLINTKFQPNTFEHRGKYVWLKDKNWKDIYTWDILQVNKAYNGYTWMSGEIYWDYRVEVKEKKVLWFYFDWWMEWTYKATEFEVIWNIYENPGLIK